MFSLKTTFLAAAFVATSVSAQTLSTCGKIEQVGHILYASNCVGSSGTYSASIDLDNCVTNENSNLMCYPDGYYRTCSSCSTTAGVLSCVCEARDATYAPSSTDLNSCITILTDGQLQCAYYGGTYGGTAPASGTTQCVVQEDGCLAGAEDTLYCCIPTDSNSSNCYNTYLADQAVCYNTGSAASTACPTSDPACCEAQFAAVQTEVAAAAEHACNRASENDYYYYDLSYGSLAHQSRKRAKRATLKLAGK